MMNLDQRKAEALRSYQEARTRYCENMTPENWRAFCEAKRVCRLLGCRI